MALPAEWSTVRWASISSTTVTHRPLSWRTRQMRARWHFQRHSAYIYLTFKVKIYIQRKNCDPSTWRNIRFQLFFEGEKEWLKQKSSRLKPYFFEEIHFHIWQYVWKQWQGGRVKAHTIHKGYSPIWNFNEKYRLRPENKLGVNLGT